MGDKAASGLGPGISGTNPAIAVFAPVIAGPTRTVGVPVLRLPYWSALG